MHTATPRDRMLVCRNGHVITDRLTAYPDLRLPRCDRCGEVTVDRCDTCGQVLAGAYPVHGLEPIGTRPPIVCTTCGASFPWARADEPPDDTLLGKLEHLLRRLPRVARELRSRPGASFDVRDDRDLDDLVRVVLPIHFDDIRPEARTPRYSAGNRTAFLLPEAASVVIAQLAGPTVGEAELDRRRTEDLDQYRGRTGYAKLVWFVYDPEGRLPNSERAEAVWSRPSAGLVMRCVVAG